MDARESEFLKCADEVFFQPKLIIGLAIVDMCQSRQHSVNGDLVFILKAS